MAKGIARRNSNGSVYLPKWIWEWINVADGEQIIYQDDKGKNGHFISFWKKEEIAENNSTNKLDSTDHINTQRKCKV